MGGALALDAAWLFAAVLVILIVAAACIAVRRYLLERGGGTVECGLRRAPGSWRLGLASYQGEDLCWYGVFGISLRPSETFPRRDLSVVSRRVPSDAEAASLGPGMIVVECELSPPAAGPPAASRTPARRAPARRAPARRTAARHPQPTASTAASRTVELALGEAALTGLLSWLEASPPGSHLGDVAL